MELSVALWMENVNVALVGQETIVRSHVSREPMERTAYNAVIAPMVCIVTHPMVNASALLAKGELNASKIARLDISALAVEGFVPAPMAEHVTSSREPAHAHQAGEGNALRLIYFRCDRPCPDGRYGDECRFICDCATTNETALYNPFVARCDHITGDCRCPPGWTGPDCATPCPPGRWGSGCSSECECSNGATCDRLTGFCDCPAGFMGKNCETECPEGLWGANCIHHCLCMHDGGCNPKTGECTCAAGWTGPACEFLCPFGQYGLNCELRCDCKNGANCNRTTGQCECLPGWRGERYDNVSVNARLAISERTAKRCVSAKTVLHVIRLADIVRVRQDGEDENAADLASKVTSDVTAHKPVVAPIRNLAIISLESANALRGTLVMDALRYVLLPPDSNFSRGM
ncbi:EGF-like domain protein [Cooperia oncophora]